MHNIFIDLATMIYRKQKIKSSIGPAIPPEVEIMKKKMNAHIDCNKVLAQPFLAFAHAVSAFIEFDLVACWSVLY